MKSTFFGSALGLLLAFSVISYSKTFIQQQDTRPARIHQPTVLEVAGQVPEVVRPTPPFEGSEGTSPADLAGNSTASSRRGRTASGQPASRGLIGADPSVLPLGTRVRVEAGSWSGEYVVADTGGAVKGRRIDIWTPTTREALQFGRR